MNLNQITIPSLDVKKATKFYQKLGLKLIVDAIPNYVRFEMPEGDATFSIHKVNALPSKNRVAIYFENSNLDKLVKELVEKGFYFDLLPTDQSWLWREARLKDVDGNLLILYKAGKNRKNPPWRIN